MGMIDSPPSENTYEDFRILIVDDLPTNLKVLSHLVRKQGAQVDLCSSGEEALGLFASNQYHMILLDLHMPAMSGYEVGEKMVAMRDGPLPFIVAQTADETNRACRRTSEIGFDGHLTKPIRPDSVRDLLFSIKQLAEAT